ncbi:MAG: response regulator [Lachnospiraceae bacterium]|nr:response regulator [Lachnospiraceae bacterium]
MGKVILAIDDEEHILELLAYNLENNGFKVLTASSGEDGLEIIKKENIDLILLDIMLPGIDGMEMLKRLRKNPDTADLPVIMLTAKSEEINKVLGLEVGADDYISKPFGIYELVARVKAVLRRSERNIGSAAAKEESYDVIAVDKIVINNTTHEVIVDGKVVELALKEFELLYTLAKNRTRVFSRETLLDKIWGYEYAGETRTVDVHIRNLRKKIEEDDNKPKYIKTVRGVGYKFS